MVLTKRQQEIYDYLIQGMSFKEIGYELGINHVTVKNHYYLIIEKYNVKSRYELIVNYYKKLVHEATVAPQQLSRGI